VRACFIIIIIIIIIIILHTSGTGQPLAVGHVRTQHILQALIARQARFVPSTLMRNAVGSVALHAVCRNTPQLPSLLFFPPRRLPQRYTGLFTTQ
jgi:hypothetical protein